MQCGKGTVITEKFTYKVFYIGVEACYPYLSFTIHFSEMKYTYWAQVSADGYVLYFLL